MSWYSGQTRVGTAVVFATLATVGTPPLAAMTMQECSAKYRAAQTSGTLGRTTWQDFRKKNCGSSPTLGYTATTFPKGIAPKYRNEPVGKARMHTCLDQYRANKAANPSGGQRWIEKGGGYYSECNKRLKG
jgi:Ni/Co efflux regulator RcnB